MRSFTDVSWDFATRASLDRVCVPFDDHGKAPPVSIWMDPVLTVF